MFKLSMPRFVSSALQRLTSSMQSASVLILAAVAVGKVPFRLSNAEHSSAFRYILFPWVRCIAHSSFTFCIINTAAWLSAPSFERYNLTFDHIGAPISGDVVLLSSFSLC